MFTGIIEQFGTIHKILHEDNNIHFWIQSNLTSELKIDQSVAHNGICLTIVAIENNSYKVTAVNETLQKTTAKNWEIGDTLNLERAMILGSRLDGHIVQGHVDTTATCTQALSENGNHLFEFKIPDAYIQLIIEKGSICINGVSLTIFNLSRNHFWVTIIPYTYTHTTFNRLNHNDVVNIEFDIIGKYILRKEQLTSMP
jgi:riboflavin synthase